MFLIISFGLFSMGMFTLGMNGMEGDFLHSLMVATACGFWGTTGLQLGIRMGREDDDEG